MDDAPISLSNLSLTTFSGKDPSKSALDFWNSVDQKNCWELFLLILIRIKNMKIDRDHYLSPF